MITKGTNEFSNIVKGNKEFVGVYKGDKEIWSNVKAISLGQGQTFDIKNVYKKWNELTADNFYARSFPSVYASNTVYNHYGEHVIYATCSSSYNKSYSNGILTFRGVSDGSSRSYKDVNVFLVTKNDKVTSLGTTNDYDITTLLPNVDYTTLTADNFYIRVATSVSGWQDVEPEETRTVTSNMTFTKNYNAQTGQLELHFNTSYTPWGDTPQKVAVEVFYIPTNFFKE